MIKIKGYCFILLSFWIFGFSISTRAEQTKEPFGIPSFRFANEHYQDAAQRNIAELKESAATSPGQWLDAFFGFDAENSAFSVAKPRQDLDFSSLESWNNEQQVEHAFISGRDSRFLILAFDGSQEKRRISWMFPQDGCFVRAEVFKNRLKKFGYPSVKKIFAFGDLSATTHDTESGSVNWWFHVAVVVGIGDQAMVLDPAVEPDRPVTVEEWAKLISPQPDKLTFSLCDAGTFGPMNGCDAPKVFSSFFVDLLQGVLLRLEQTNLLALGRNVGQELLESPYWRTHSTENSLPFLQSVKYYSAFNPEQKVGGVFANYNDNLGKIEYFKHIGNAQNLLLPDDSKNNEEWTYLGNNYPIQFDVVQTIGLVVPRFHFFTGKTDYFRLLQRGLLGFSYPMPFERRDTPYWEYMHSSH